MSAGPEDQDEAASVPEAELAVLGAILLEPAVATQLDGIVNPTDFLDPRHELIWNAIDNVRDNGSLPDALTVNKQLTNQGDLLAVGGAPYLHTLIQACNNPANVIEYGTQVRDAARLRLINSTAIKLRQLARNGNPETIDNVLADALQALDDTASRVARGTRRTPEDHRAQYLTRDQLKDLPAPEPLIDGVLTRHAYGILRGRDDSFKSFVALDWGLSLATGRTWQGHPAQTVRVLYIAGEGAHGLTDRLDAWERAWHLNIPDHMLTIRKTALNMFRPGPAFDHLLDTVTEGQYGLVIIDTLRRVAGTADGNSSEMGAVVDNIDRLKQATTDGSVLVVAHTDKGDNDSRGYSGIEDDADVVWHAKRDGMNLTLENTKMKDGPGGRIHNLQAITAGPSLVLQETSPSKKTTTESQVKLLDTLRHDFPNGTYSTAFKEASNVAPSTFHRALADLLHAGHIIDTGVKRKPYYELARSQEIPPPETPSDLRRSHNSHEVPPFGGGTPTGPTPLKGGTWDHDSTNTEEKNTA